MRYLDSSPNQNVTLTVGEALDQWFKSRTNTIGPNTSRDYRLSIAHQLKPFKFPVGSIADDVFLRPAIDNVIRNDLSKPRHLGGPSRRIDAKDHRILANLPLSALNDLLINTIRDCLLEDGLSVKRVNNLMAPLRGAVERQFRLKRLEFNPFELVQPLKKSLLRRRDTVNLEEMLDAPLPDDRLFDFRAAEGDPDPLTTDELRTVLSTLDPPMARQMLFACWTGLRTGELIALRTSDLQLDRNRILVRRSLSRGILKTTKTDSHRWVDLLPPARAALEAQLKLGAAQGWVFPNPFTRTRWANDSKITRRWKKALALAGVRYRRPYQTRHTYASMMLSAGENPLYVAKQMGHADWGMLVRVYGRWIPAAGAHSEGSLVASAHAGNWPNVLEVVMRDS